MIQFFMLKLQLGGAACHQPPKFELPIAQEEMVYKIWDSVYKIVQNKYKIMIYFSFSKSVWGAGGGDMYLFSGMTQTQVKSFISNTQPGHLRTKGYLYKVSQREPTGNEPDPYKTVPPRPKTKKPKRDLSGRNRKVDPLGTCLPTTHYRNFSGQGMKFDLIEYQRFQKRPHSSPAIADRA